MPSPSVPHTDLGAGSPVVIGSPFEVAVPLVSGDQNDPATGYAGTEAVSAVATTGPGQPAAWTIAAAWDDPFDAANPAIVLSWAADVTSDVEAGTYYVVATIDGVDAYLGTVGLIGGVDAAGEVAPTPLISIEEFYARVGNWAGSLQSGTTLAGLRRTLSIATADLYDALADRYARVYLSTTYYGTYRSEYLLALETPGKLTTSDAMKDFVAAMAILRLVEFDPSAKDDGSIERIIARAEARAKSALSRIVVVLEGYPTPVGLSGQSRVVRG